MNWSVRIALASLLGLAAVGVVLMQKADAPAVAAPAEVAEAPNVRVEHELVIIEPPAALAAAAVAAPGAPKAAPRVTPRRTRVEKARNVLLGDGRHKPQPFPRLR